MRRHAMRCFLAAEAAACVVLCFLRMHVFWMFSEIAAFPFEQVGWGLRLLSLSGWAGNAAAVVLYSLISLIPLLVWLVLKRKRRHLPIDFVLPGLSLLLFIVNYYMINPGLPGPWISGSGKWLLGCTFYSVLFAYLVIRLLAVYREVDAEKLQRGLQGLLWVLSAVLIYIIFGKCLDDVLTTADTIQSADSGILSGRLTFGEEHTGIFCLFLGLRYIVNVLPYVFDLGIAFMTGRILTVLNDDRYSDEAMARINHLAVFCQRALGITVMSNAAFNLLQCLFCGSLRKIDMVVQIPVMSVIFVLTALLFSRYLHEEQKLKREHDLII